VKSLRLVLLLFSAAIVLTSCLDIAMELDLRSDGSAILDGTYDIPRDVWDRGAFDEDNPNRIIPVSRRDLQELLALWDGVSLDRYRIRRDDTHVVVRFRISADDPEALADLWSGVSARADQTDFSPQTGTLVLPITSSRDPVDPDAADFMRGELRGGTYRLSVSTPGTINEIRSPADGRYLLADGGRGSRKLVLEAELADLVLDPDAYVISLGWE